MEWIIKLLGGGLLLLLAVYISREYSEFLDRRLAELEKSGADISTERESADKNRKMARALLIGGALAAIVMII
jgi:hypothetical protein